MRGARPEAINSEQLPEIADALADWIVCESECTPFAVADAAIPSGSDVMAENHEPDAATAPAATGYDMDAAIRAIEAAAVETGLLVRCASETVVSAQRDAVLRFLLVSIAARGANESHQP
ncbi:Hypothetical protein UVM_LOCUS332 [uncultured virus]|nr:Hypothetical protein UVM_LOCUS332 [uncultured virus]